MQGLVSPTAEPVVRGMQAVPGVLGMQAVPGTHAVQGRRVLVWRVAVPGLAARGMSAVRQTWKEPVA